MGNMFNRIEKVGHNVQNIVKMERVLVKEKCNGKCGNGNNEETEECNKQPCPKWSAWSQPSLCDTKSCEASGSGFTMS